MSLELAIQQNTAAINSLIEILKNGGIAPPATDTPAADVAETPKATKRARKEPEAPAEETKAAPIDEQPQQVTRDQVSKALTRLASKKGRDAAVAALAGVGAATLGEVEAGDYPAVLSACEAALA